MNLSLRLRLMLALAGAVLVPAAQALVVIDDFSSGPAALAMQAHQNPDAVSTLQEQAGSMASGIRDWSLLLRGAPASTGRIGIGPAGLVLRAVAGVAHRFDLYYGGITDHLMHLDLSQESTLRFSFADAPLGVSLVVLLYYRNEFDNYSEIGMNLPQHDGPFTADFSLADFAAHPANTARGADLTWVSHIHVITQSGAVTSFGGEGYRLTSISAVPEPASAPLWLVGAAGLAALRRLQQCAR